MSDTALNLFDYELPPELIAQRPADFRDRSRLMLLGSDNPPEHKVFSDIIGMLREGDLLVRNDTKVIPARLRGKRSGGGRTEILLVHRLGGQPGIERWMCLARPTGHLKPGKEVSIGDGAFVAVVEKMLGGGRIEARFEFTSSVNFMGLLDEFGEIPLPPYIEREEGPDSRDGERYQTSYAANAGAVAAPTAGLHFTEEVDRELLAKGVGITHVTLHVGPGTFRPIIAEDILDHEMDEEWYSVPSSTAERINSAKAEGRRVIAVGTTSTRTLETAAAVEGRVKAGEGWSRLFIRPGFGFKIIDGLLTNFHLPRSSLLVLVSALAGRERMIAAYEEAVREQYRFYSYGDAMLIMP